MQMASSLSKNDDTDNDQRLELDRNLHTSNSDNNDNIDGELELEVDFENESELNQRFDDCLKNPKHEEFIPLNSLKIEDLPEAHQTRFALEFIRYASQFTVKLQVNYVSHERSGDYIKGNVRHVGSGWVARLPESESIRRRRNDSEVKEMHFIVVTAAHVIFDTSEAQKTEVEFFYDDPHDRSSVRKAFGVRVLNTNVEADFSEVLCVTKDKSIIKLLKTTAFFTKIRTSCDQLVLESNFDKYFSKAALKLEYQPVLSEISTLTPLEKIVFFVMKKEMPPHRSLLEFIISSADEPSISFIEFVKCKLKPRLRKFFHSFNISRDNEKKDTERVLYGLLQDWKHDEFRKTSKDLAVHISHPHGMFKHITLGEVAGSDTRNGHYQLIYTLATCKGSSGGPVFIIPTEAYDETNQILTFEAIYSVPHARHYGDKLNASSSWTSYFADHQKCIYLGIIPSVQMPPSQYMEK